MWPLAFLMADFINKKFFKRKLENVWPFCRAKKNGRNTEVIVLLGFVRCNEVSLYRGFFIYLQYHQSEVRKIVPCTENFVISRLHCIDKQHRRLVTLQTKNTCIAAFFFFLPILYFDLLYLVFFS